MDKSITHQAIMQLSEVILAVGTIGKENNTLCFQGLKSVVLFFSL